MTSFRITLASFALALASAGAAHGQSIERGEELVRRHCGGCHAVGTSGESKEPAAPPFRELYHRYDPDALAESLAEGILTGHPAMPEFRFSAPDVKAITAYLRSIQAHQPT